VRERRDVADIPGCLSQAALHRAGGRVLRVESDQVSEGKAIAMKDGKPFGIGGVWDNWKDPATGEWIRTFAVITTAANELVADICRSS
jgi:hypothetical protein